jgi:hypothetical protein
MSIELGVLVKSTILLAAAGLAACLLTRASASLRHTLWLVTLAGLLVLPVAEVLLPKIALPVLPRERAAIGTDDTDLRDPESLSSEATEPAGEERSRALPVAAATAEREPRPAPGVPWLAALWAVEAREAPPAFGCL